MKFISKNLFFFIGIGVCFLFFSCHEEDYGAHIIEGNNSVINYLDKDPDYSIFSQAIHEVGLAPVLDGNSGSYTIFAPKNSAFKTFFAENGYSSLADIDTLQLKNIVKYHLLETLSNAESFATGYVKTLTTIPVNDSVDSNLDLYVKADSGKISLNGKINLVDADIEVDNGILHEVDHVLDLPTVNTFLEADGNLTPFYSVVKTDTNTDFEKLFTTTDDFNTFFIPGADAVQTYLDGAAQELDAQEKDNLYRNHFLQGKYLNSQFKTGYISTQATARFSGKSFPISLYLNTQTGLVLNGNTNIVTANLVAENGVLHVTDNLLYLPTLADFIKADLELRVLANAFSREDQAVQKFFKNFSDPTQTHTIFAPTNEAFDALLTELFPDQDASLETIGKERLTSILKLHLLSGENLRSENFPSQLQTDGGIIDFQGNSNITDSNSRKANFVILDAQASNGVLHKVDKVLLP